MDAKPIEISSEAIAALENGNKIEAIKIIRLAQGLGLKESKDIVEVYLKTNPELDQRFKSKQSENSRPGRFIFLLIIIGIIAYVIFSLRT